MRPLNTLEARRGPRAQRGTTLVELMIALLILSVGLGALTTLLATVVASDNKNSKDTSASLVAQMVIELITAQHPNSSAAITVTDCAGNTFTISTTGGASPNGAGANLVTSSSTMGYGGIDQTQSFSAITSGYSMKYTDCSTVGSVGTAPTKYDVRWNVMTIDANQTRLITASARVSSGSTQLGGQLLAFPVTLRAVGGP
jgi:prepilin-type N-terminal cleavage/methylation domain-containing protein